MIKLICDLNISLRGHNAGHVQYIVNHIKEKEDDTIYFLFNKEAGGIINISASTMNASRFFYADTDFSDDNWSSRLKFNQWKVIQHFAATLKIDELFIMELTRYEIQIGFRKSPFLISGIEFRPSHRIAIKEGKMSDKLSAKIQHFKRYFFETILLRSSSINHIFILNDPSGAAILNDRYRTEAFRSTADPIYDYPEPEGDALKDLISFEKDKVVYTVFGSLDWRKNINNIFAAFGTIDKTLHRNMVLLIVGKIPKHFNEEFQQLMLDFKSQCPDIELITINQFVTDGQMEYYFRHTDVSLVIYPKFYGSSGLLGRAAKYDAISLAPNVGLMAEICEHYKLGYLCDPYSPKDIGEKIAAAYRDVQENKGIDGSKFYRDHSPERFLELLDF